MGADRFIPSRGVDGNEVLHLRWEHKAHANGGATQTSHETSTPTPPGESSSLVADERGALLRRELLGPAADEPTLRVTFGSRRDKGASSTPRDDPTFGEFSSSSSSGVPSSVRAALAERREGGGLSSSSDASLILDGYSALEGGGRGRRLAGTTPRSSRLGMNNSSALCRRRPIGTAEMSTNAPYKVLDAPELADDFYLDLVAWSARNVLAVGLGSKVALWSGCATHKTELCDLGPDDAVSSVAWTNNGTHLAVGSRRGAVYVWDVHRARPLFGDSCLHGSRHASRVGCLSWRGDRVLSSGSRDKAIATRDVREPSRCRVSRLTGAHKQEVCGLRWSPCGDFLASGGNDNKLLVWRADTALSGGGGGGTGLGCSSSSSAAGGLLGSSGSSASLASLSSASSSSSSRTKRERERRAPACRFSEHVAAVKAIAWSPHRRGLLASGAGTADRTVKFWNCLTNAKLNSVDTGSQVCALAWSPSEEWELVSTHGYSLNHVCVWRLDRRCRVLDYTTLLGHTQRVLYLATSPDGKSLVTGAGDETLRFWRVWAGYGAGCAAGRLSGIMGGPGLLGSDFLSAGGPGKNLGAPLGVLGCGAAWPAGLR